ncbi:bifunctional lysylphosphatidylglycerol flippase/synthetase MprF [Clostridium felsineum]|uniref:Phosphatidylglycerol lysyltransferase n=1 Tax=Clostridium felsineum TaxID=36839 RepID=A0A1S8L2J6_9CLOT|nr:DUF2156 domain-containing protein [Clostridium felsineum]URZ08405.1 Phosphatidylglycerol lysyltransferase [Clostridium felsineum]URZ13436.1 Phosphatidylglycerol lysyltransferase [Clostridium felsineum]
MQQLLKDIRMYQAENCLDYAANLVTRYGKDSLSYLTLERDKKYFFASKTEGFIAYTVIDNVAVCMGDLIYEEGTLEVLYNEFVNFAKKERLRICFSSVSEEFSEFLKKHGFSISKYGEEAIILLNTYELKGSSTSKLRQKLSRAHKAGIKVIEYIPEKRRDYDFEEKIIDISEQWLSNRDGKLGFSLGDLNFDKPLGRRYFVAIDETEKLHAIITFLPFCCKNGYFLDVMRRSCDSIPGVIEKSIIDGIMKMKEEGIELVSLGLAPLAGIKIISGNCTTLEKGMHYMYKNFNQGYDFKNLHNYKKKFNPTQWNSRYIAYEASLSPIRVAYAMIKARKKDGVWWILLKWLWQSMKKFALKLK